MYRPRPPIEVLTNGQNRETTSCYQPDGWSYDMVTEALEMGYSMFALHQLQPSPKKWDLAKLREFSSTQDVNNLDPYLSRLIVDYINSAIDRIPGFKITDGMRASRQAKQGQLGFGPPP